MTRIHKFLADSGVCSRRKAEALVAEGRVTVNGRMAVIGDKAAFDDEVCVDGTPISFKDGLRPSAVWIMLNKPEGYVTTAKDQFGRKTVFELLHGVNQRLFTVGRLDYDTSGLLLFTNDGVTANKIAHPRYNAEKVYLARVAEKPCGETLEKLRTGVEVDGRMTRPAKIEAAGEENGGYLIEIRIKEGRNRIVRKMCAVVGHKVLALKRVMMGGLELGDLKKGKFRYLRDEEINQLTIM
jgi:23S rRNA pseudouridine2605 synthase